MSDLIALAERCEALTKPCHETNVAIALVDGFVLERRGKDRKEWLYPVEGSRHGFRLEPSPYGSAHGRVPNYTASLDAAMSLVPEGAEWALMRDGLLLRFVAGVNCFTANAATPALALTAAALRAMAYK